MVRMVRKVFSVIILLFLLCGTVVPSFAALPAQEGEARPGLAASWLEWLLAFWPFPLKSEDGIQRLEEAATTQGLEGGTTVEEPPAEEPEIGPQIDPNG